MFIYVERRLATTRIAERVTKTARSCRLCFRRNRYSVMYLFDFRTNRLLAFNDITIPEYAVLSHRWQDETAIVQQTNDISDVAMSIHKPERPDLLSQPISDPVRTELREKVGVALAIILGWTGSDVAYRYARQRAGVQPPLPRHFLSTIAQEQDGSWYPIRQSCLFDQFVSDGTSENSHGVHLLFLGTNDSSTFATDLCIILHSIRVLAVVSRISNQALALSRFDPSVFDHRGRCCLRRD